MNEVAQVDPNDRVMVLLDMTSWRFWAIWVISATAIAARAEYITNFMIVIYFLTSSSTISRCLDFLLDSMNLMKLFHMVHAFIVKILKMSGLISWLDFVVRFLNNPRFANPLILVTFFKFTTLWQLISRRLTSWLMYRCGQIATFQACIVRDFEMQIQLK